MCDEKYPLLSMGSRAETLERGPTLTPEEMLWLEATNTKTTEKSSLWLKHGEPVTGWDFPGEDFKILPPKFVKSKMKGTHLVAFVKAQMTRLGQGVSIFLLLPNIQFSTLELRVSDNFQPFNVQL